MSDIEVKLMKRSRGEVLIGQLVSVASLVVLYYSVNPSALEAHKEAIANVRDRVLHRISIWQARQEIASLPET